MCKDMEPTYFKLYSDNWKWLCELSRIQEEVLFFLVDNVKYDKELDGMVIAVNKYQREKMSKQIGVSNLTSLANALTALVNKNIVCRISTGTYLLNPHYIGFPKRKCEGAKQYFV